MENLTQFSAENSSKEINVTIGLDFGTSSSKVVIRVQEFTKSYPVLFEDGYSGKKFLLPTRPYFDLNGSLQLAGVNNSIPLRELKLSILGNENASVEFTDEKEIEASAEILTISYLARVIQLSRNWFLKNYRESYEQFKVSWNLNLGVPSVGNQYRLKKEEFLNIAKAAWCLSLTDPISYDKAKTTIDHMHNDTLKLEEINSVNVIQEVIAQVLGYVYSDSRNEGLHVLIDVGAGTLDISTFNLFEEDGRLKCPIFTGEVLLLGGFEVHKKRILKVKEFVNNWLSEFGKLEDPVKAIAERIEDYEPNLRRNYNLETIDREFSDICEMAIQKNLFELKKKNPNAPEFRSGITTFMCGGGRSISIYRNVLKEINEMAKKSGTPKLEKKSLPKPERDLETRITRDDYHRISVAYGLSFPFDHDLDVKTPDEIKYAPTPDPPADITEIYPYDNIN